MKTVQPLYKIVPACASAEGSAVSLFWRITR